LRQTLVRRCLVAGAVELTEIRCSCPPGTQGTQPCNYGRRCGLLKANGEDVARITLRLTLIRGRAVARSPSARF